MFKYISTQKHTKRYRKIQNKLPLGGEGGKEGSEHWDWVGSSAIGRTKMKTK